MCTQNCASSATEVQRASGHSRDAITRLAESDASPACAASLHVLPYLNGERTPQWARATGAIIGLRPGTLEDSGRLYRAAIEGSTFALLHGMNKCAFVAHAELPVIRTPKGLAARHYVSYAFCSYDVSRYFTCMPSCMLSDGGAHVMSDLVWKILWMSQVVSHQLQSSFACPSLKLSDRSGWPRPV